MPTRAPRHRPAHAKPRASAHARGYGAHWKKVRAVILSRDPVCVVCRHAPSLHVDHIVAHVVGEAHDPANLRGLCASCHGRKTVRDDGGFGR